MTQEQLLQELKGTAAIMESLLAKRLRVLGDDSAANICTKQAERLRDVIGKIQNQELSA